MLEREMTLQEMVKFEPNETEMANLPLNATVYLKVSLISLNKEDNYDFLRFLFSDEEVSEFINDIEKTIFYDFDGTSTNQEKFITILELTSPAKFSELSIYLEDILNSYSHEADVVIDMYCHDDKKYRLSNLYGIVKLEEMNNA